MKMHWKMSSTKLVAILSDTAQFIFGRCRHSMAAIQTERMWEDSQLRQTFTGNNNKEKYSSWWRHPWWRHQVETFSALPALCDGNPPVTGGFPSQRASNTENVFIWWRQQANASQTILANLSEISGYLPTTKQKQARTVCISLSPVFRCYFCCCCHMRGVHFHRSAISNIFGLVLLHVLILMVIKMQVLFA